MYKKLLIATSFIIMAIFSFTICYANDGLQDAADGVRNVVGDAENAVEGAAKDISNASKDATGKMEQSANNMYMNTANGTNNNYTATRTATTDNTFMGMNATAWTWLIMGIAAIAIIALVWYYSMQLRSSNERD